jgi:hypothetical protein
VKRCLVFSSAFLRRVFDAFLRGFQRHFGHFWGGMRARTYDPPLFAIFGVGTQPPDMGSAATSFFYLVKKMSPRAFLTLSVPVLHDQAKHYESCMQTQSPYHFTV